MTGPRRHVLHPLTPALALLAVVAAGPVVGAPAALLALAAGCAAGFANSGST